MRKLFHTDDAWTGFILRMTVGLVMLPMARRRCSIWFGGSGFDGTMGFLRKRWASLDRRVSGHHRGVLRQPSGCWRGLLTRVTAASFIVIMLGAILTVHAPVGFHELARGQRSRVKATNIICS